MLLIKGVLTGIILSFPFGPVGIYCMEKAMVKGEKKAYVSALGMVSVDVIYGIISFLFIYQLEGYILKYQDILKIFISVFLIFIGGKKMFKKPEIKELYINHFTLIQDYFETFLLAIFNISSILVIAGIYTIFDVVAIKPNIASNIQLATGIGVGGSAMWATTIAMIHHFKKRLTLDIILKLSKLSGYVITIFGIGTIIFAFYK